VRERRGGLFQVNLAAVKCEESLEAGPFSMDRVAL
jgi:hypothetical protein